MFRSHRSFIVPELDVAYTAMEVRSRHLRVSWHQGTRVTSDYQLLEHASPFVHRMSRASMTILLDGAGRFEEGERRIWTTSGEIVTSDAAERGTEAYTGARTSLLVIDWDAREMGASMKGGFRATHLSNRDRARLQRLARRLDGLDPAGVVLEILDLLRACGIAFNRPHRGDLADRASEPDRRLSAAIDAALSRLDAHPAIDDAAAELGWTTRHANRRFSALAQSFNLPWEHWRSMLHQTRLSNAFRLLSVPNATTELVARHTGYRSPTALCHAFAKVGLPSPQALAAAARRDVLDAWTAFAKPSPRAA